MNFIVVIHYMGEFVNESSLTYERGEIHAIHKINIDKWSYFEAMNLIKNDLRYDGGVKLWWRIPGASFDDGLRSIT